MMRVTFVQPRYFNIWEALGVAYVAAYVKRRYRGPLEARFLQGYFDEDRLLVESGAESDVVAFSCVSPVFQESARLAAEIKERSPSTRIVVGGFHASAAPDECLREEAVDQVVVGEGEKAFLRILNGDESPIVRGEAFDELSEIRPDRELIRNDRTVDLCESMSGGMRAASFQSVRVCPFNCAFCSERVVTGKHDARRNPVRERDAGHLLDEIEAVAARYSLNYFKFVDATWNTSRSSTEKIVRFCEEKNKRGNRLPWEANLHAARVDKKMLALMRSAECRLINVGCESGSQRILNQMRKCVRVEQVRDVFRWGREVGLERRGYFLLGMPDETVDDIRLTEKLVEEIEPDVFGITMLCPYPGSDFYDPKTMGGFDWSVADEYGNPYWRTKRFSNAELREWQGRFAKKFARNLTWHQRLLMEDEKE